MAKKILNDINKQNTILERISKTGKEIGCWEGVCTERTFYRYMLSNSQFSQSVKEAKDKFRMMLWQERDDLKELAIAGLEKSLKGTKQAWIKKIFVYDEDGKEILSQKQVGESQNPPSPWAIRCVLGIDQKNEENVNSVSELRELLSEMADETKKRDLK